MADKFMYIPNGDTLSVYYNWWLKRFDNQLNKPTTQNSIKVHVVKPMIKKTLS